MKNKIIKIFLILVIALTIFNNFNVYAIQNPLQNPSEYDPTNYGEDEQELKKMTGQVLGIINVVGVVISVIALMIIGIRYMLGSVDEKAEYKKTLIGYLVGVILLFSATTIPNILYNIGTSIGEYTPSSPSTSGGGHSEWKQNVK